MDTADLEGKACIFVGLSTAYVVKEGKWYRIEREDPNPRTSSDREFHEHVRMGEIQRIKTYPADNFPFVDVRRELELEHGRAQTMSILRSILMAPSATHDTAQLCCYYAERSMQNPEIYEFIRQQLVAGLHPIEGRPEVAYQVAVCAGARKLAELFQELQQACENRSGTTYASASELNNAVKKLVPGTAIITASHAMARRHDGSWFMVRLENGLPVIRVLYDAIDAENWAKIWHMRALQFELDPRPVPTSVHEYDFVKDALTIRD